MRGSIGGTRRAFTLIELLVVISILTLLISLIMGGLSGARRRARLMQCTSNLKQHGMGMAGHAANERDRLPNAPEGNGEAGVGPRGRPAYKFAMDPESGPATNGWAFQGGLYTHLKFWTEDGANPDIQRSYLWDAYWIVLSPWLIEGEGIGALRDVFLSPSHTDRATNWSAWREWVQARRGDLGSPASEPRYSHDSGLSPFSVGSYRYTPTAYITRESFMSAESMLALDSERKVNPNRIVWNTSASIQFPSSKVMFWSYASYHDSRRGGVKSRWDLTPDMITLCAADGSARAVRPPMDVLATPQPDDAAGSWPIIGLYGSDWSDAHTPKTFYATCGGLAGRDLK